MIKGKTESIKFLNSFVIFLNLLYNENFIKKKVFFILFLIVICCKKENIPFEAVINVNKISDNIILLNKWQILGPFSSNNKEHFITIDNLELFGFNEESIRFQEFVGIRKQMARDTNLIDTSFTNKFYFSGKIPVDFIKLLGVDKDKFKGNVYAACLIKCKKDINTRLHFASTGAQKIWLNNKLICSVDYSKPLNSYEQFIPVNLKRGINFLLVKVNKRYHEWEMYARFENFSETALKRYFGLRNHWILNESIFDKSDSITLNSKISSCIGRIIILDENENILMSDSINETTRWMKDISFFKKGLYLAKFKSGNFTLLHHFYKGDIHDTISKIIKEIYTLKPVGRIKDIFDALIYRYNHLLKHTYLTDKKFVYLFMEFCNIYNGLKKGTDPFHHTTGCFIRCYISSIDSSKQYYILHVPSSYKKENSFPIALVVPATVYGDLPYLESFRVANTKLIEYFQDLAEKYRMIIIEAGSRRYKLPNYNTIEETELFNIIKDVEKDYTIDKKRIYLTGTCSGGNEAIRIAVHFPDVFAAIGIVSPEIIYPDEGKISPIPFIKNIASLPIYNTHSLIDRHIAVERSELLALLAKKNNFKNFTYVRLPDEFPMYYPDDFFDNALEFCSKYSLNLSPKEVYFKTPNIMYNKSFWIKLNIINSPDTAYIHAKIKGNTLKINKKNVLAYSIDLKTLPYDKQKPLIIIDNKTKVFKGIVDDSILYIGQLDTQKVKNWKIAGPFMHIFADRFLVVKGTAGGKEVTDRLNLLADTINQLWKERYFVSCRIKNDYEITEKDILESHLILLGNFESNLLLSRLKDNIPLKIGKTEIQIGKKVIRGTCLCFYIIYPNPVNKNKYIAIIGYNNPEYISLGSENNSSKDISSYGWYDYKVWKANFLEHTVSTGYFNYRWELY